MEKNLIVRHRKLILVGFVALTVVVIGAAIGLLITHKSHNTHSVKTASNTKKVTVKHKAIIAPPKTSPNATPQQIKAPAADPSILFSDPLNGPDRIVTNEFVHWSKSSCPYTSTKWDMTSGTLFIKNGAGYSGLPTLEKTVPCESSKQTNSAIFRLNTRQSNFSNVTVSLDYNAVTHGGSGAPVNAYDGIHVWVGYQSEYALYAATIYRWDGTIVTKKKVPQATAGCVNASNEGCYYSLAKESLRKDLTTPNTWHHVDVQYFSDTNAKIHIATIIDGVKAADVIDTDTHGPAYTSGAVGIRGDNTEFYFKNFQVKKYTP